MIVEKLVDIYDKGGEGEDSKLADDPSAKPNVYLLLALMELEKQQQLVN